MVRKFLQQVKFNVRPRQVISRSNILSPEGVAFRRKYGMFKIPESEVRLLCPRLREASVSGVEQMKAEGQCGMS